MLCKRHCVVLFFFFLFQRMILFSQNKMALFNHNITTRDYLKSLVHELWLADLLTASEVVVMISAQRWKIVSSRIVVTRPHRNWCGLAFVDWIVSFYDNWRYFYVPWYLRLWMKLRLCNLKKKLYLYSIFQWKTDTIRFWMHLSSGYWTSSTVYI